MLFSSLLRYAALCTLCSLILTGCASDPVAPVVTPKVGENAVFIVSEGQFGNDNAALSRYDVKSAQTDAQWFAANNNGQKLGATANDIVIQGDTAFIALTDSKTIEVVNLKTGKSVGRISFDGLEKPRKITLLSSTLGCVSLYDADGVRFFNPITFQKLDFIKTGPGAEGIASVGNSVFVANSGDGTLRADQPGAGTISVIDAVSKTVSKTVVAGPNVTELKTSADGKKLYAYYQHLYTMTDSLQGVIEYDVATMNELRRWRMQGGGNLVVAGGSVYLFNSINYAVSDILRIEASAANATVSSYLRLDTATIKAPYGFGINPADGHFWVGDAKNYTINGEVMELSTSGAILRKVAVGVSPKHFAFY